MEELDLKELFEIFWNKKIQILLIVLIFMIIGFIYTMVFVTPKYQSSTTLLLVQADKQQENATNAEITATDITLNSKLVSTYSELIKSKSVIRTVISNLNMQLDEDTVRNNVSVTSVKDTEIIEITVTNTNPSYAEKIANEIAKVFTQKVAEIYNINNVNVVDEAEVETNPYNINHIKDVTIFAFIGLVVAAIYVLLSNMLDTTIKTQEDVEKLFKLPVLANIPLYDYENEKGGKK